VALLEKQEILVLPRFTQSAMQLFVGLQLFAGLSLALYKLLLK